MALPQWLARFNRRWINPGAVKRGKWPVLEHAGRKSGTLYRTPLDAYQVEDGFLFTVNYGSTSDWPRNVVEAGRAALTKDGVTYELTNPRVVPVEEGYRLLDRKAKTPPSFVGVEKCLLVTVASSTPPASDRQLRSRSTS